MTSLLTRLFRMLRPVERAQDERVASATHRLVRSMDRAKRARPRDAGIDQWQRLYRDRLLDGRTGGIR